MKTCKISFRLLFTFVCVQACYTASAQDKIYSNFRKIFYGKVTEIGPKQIKYIATDNPGGPVYVINSRDIDSIVYANGKIDTLTGFRIHKDLTANIPQLNTWTFDLLGFTFLSVSQSYERRLKNGKVGFRIPLYIGFYGGGLAGVGTFKPNIGVYYPSNVYYYDAS